MDLQGLDKEWRGFSDRDIEKVKGVVSGHCGAGGKAQGPPAAAQGLPATPGKAQGLPAAAAVGNIDPGSVKDVLGTGRNSSEEKEAELEDSDLHRGSGQDEQVQPAEVEMKERLGFYVRR
jgi:hypothetical protein